MLEEELDEPMNMGGGRNLEATGLGDSKHAGPVVVEVPASGEDKGTKRGDGKVAGRRALMPPPFKFSDGRATKDMLRELDVISSFPPVVPLPSSLPYPSSDVVRGMVKA